MKIDLTIHSFSLTQHFRHQPRFDAHAFVDMARAFGLQGISLSLNDPDFRHLGGREVDRMDKLRAKIEAEGMSLEVDTSGTAPDHLRTMLDVAARMGATSLRTYTRHSGSPAEMAEATRRDLAAVVQDAERAGVVIVLENHEDFTGAELVGIVGAVNHPNLRILYDFGNSQMVLEDPEAALQFVLPPVHSVHVKDHVMVHPEHAGTLTVAGVPMGEGFLPIRRITRKLLDQGLRRLTFENVWAYCAPIKSGREPLPGVAMGKGSFRWSEPPFDPARIILNARIHSGEDLVSWERAALERGMAWFKAELRSLGCTGEWDEGAV